MSGDTCKRSMHTFNPAPNSVKRSDLLGVCDECQAETIIEWANRARYNAGYVVSANHTVGCSHRNNNKGYRKAL